MRNCLALFVNRTGASQMSHIGTRIDRSLQSLPPIVFRRWVQERTTNEECGGSIDVTQSGQCMCVVMPEIIVECQRDREPFTASSVCNSGLQIGQRYQPVVAAQVGELTSET